MPMWLSKGEGCNRNQRATYRQPRFRRTQQGPRRHVTGTGLGRVTVTSGTCNGKQPDNKGDTGFRVETLSYSVYA